MPEKLRVESQDLLRNILSTTLDIVDENVPFEALLEKIGYVKPCRECMLDETDQRLTTLLGTAANTQLQ